MSLDFSFPPLDLYTQLIHLYHWFDIIYSIKRYFLLVFVPQYLPYILWWFIYIIEIMISSTLSKDSFPVSFRSSVFDLYTLVIHLYHWFIMISSTLLRDHFLLVFFLSICPIYSGDSFISLIYYDIIYSLKNHFLLVSSSIWPIYSGDSFISLICYDIIYSLKSSFPVSFRSSVFAYILWWFIYIIVYFFIFSCFAWKFRWFLFI